MVKFSVGLFGLENLVGGDLKALADLVGHADRAGIHQLDISEHVVMGKHVGKYPYGDFPLPPDGPWPDALTVLTACAMRTENIRLSTGVLLSPLRNAAALAKQLATMDRLSGGRLEIGIGTGWQREEYEACNVPFEGRFGLLHEQVAVMKTLWRDSPASFSGRHHDFSDIYCQPQPVQPGGVPIWYGMAASDRNAVRIAELADGWAPLLEDPELVASSLDRIRAEMTRLGRRVDDFPVRLVLSPVFTDGVPDLEATLAKIPAFRDAGVTMFEIAAIAFVYKAEDFEGFCARLASY